MKKLFIVIFLTHLFFNLCAQDIPKPFNLYAGPRFQKTLKLYWENGIAIDFSSNLLLKKKVHLKAAYVSSRMGSAINSNAIRQDNFIIGADWRFRSSRAFQLFAGLNTGFFHADMEYEMFEVLPHNAMLFSAEAGLFYQFRFPLATSLSGGYNIINGDGVNGPGTLFPVYSQLSVFYKFNL